METFPELKGISERRVCGDRPQISPGYHENIRLKSRKMAPPKRVRLDVRGLRDESVAQAYKRELAENLGEPDDSDDPEKL